MICLLQVKFVNAAIDRFQYAYGDIRVETDFLTVLSLSNASAATSSIIWVVAADDIEEVAFGSMIHMISYILTHDIMAPYT